MLSGALCKTFAARRDKKEVAFFIGALEPFRPKLLAGGYVPITDHSVASQGEQGLAVRQQDHVLERIVSPLQGANSRDGPRRQRVAVDVFACSRGVLGMKRGTTNQDKRD